MKWFYDLSDDLKFMLFLLATVSFVAFCITVQQVVKTIYAPETLK